MYTIQDINEKKPQESFLTVVAFDHVRLVCGSKVKYVLANCVCGNSVVTRMNSIINGHAFSCGCQRKGAYKKLSLEKKKSVKYSHTNSKISAMYGAMISRCYNSKNIAYKNYGGRGVVVCDEWKENYETFLCWALENKWSSGLQLDKDIKGDGKLYSPETCLFVNCRENLLARRNTIKTIYKGEEVTISKLSNAIKIPYPCLYRNVVVLGKPIEEYIKTYKHKKNNDQRSSNTANMRFG